MKRFKHFIKESKNKIPGGVSDGMSIEDIAKKHKVSVDVIKSALKKGTKVESEHTSDKSIAKEIAMDHIAERPDYYDKLEKVEEAARTVISPKEDKGEWHYVFPDASNAVGFINDVSAFVAKNKNDAKNKFKVIQVTTHVVISFKPSNLRYHRGADSWRERFQAVSSAQEDWERTFALKERWSRDFDKIAKKYKGKHKGYYP